MVKKQSETLFESVPDNNIADNAAKSPDTFTGENSIGDQEGFVDFSRTKKGKKFKHNCAEICCKYNYDCNFICDSERELLIRIICLLINEEYGLKAIEQKIRKSELNDDKKNIESITDLLEQAIVGLGETALGAVKKAVDAAVTITDITSGLAKVASSAVETAGSVASTTKSFANIAAGTVGAASDMAAEAVDLAAVGAATAGAVGDIAGEATGLVAAGAATAGAVGDIAAEASGLAAAGAATAGAVGDIAAEASGLAAVGAVTAGAAGDIAGEATGLAAAGAVTAGAAGDIAAEASGLASSAVGTAANTASTTAAASGIAAGAAETVSGVGETVSGVGETVSAVTSTTASAAGTAANAASTTAAASGIAAGVAETVSGVGGTVSAVTSTTASAAGTAANTASTTYEIVPVALDNETDAIQLCVLNKNRQSADISIKINKLTDTIKLSCYEQSITVSSGCAAFFTLAAEPGEYEIQINGLSNDIEAYCVIINKANNILSSKTPVEAKILYMFPG